MAPRYLILHSRDTSALETRTETIEDRLDVATLLEADCLRVFTTSDTPIVPFLDGNGLIIGHLFDRQRSNQRVTRLDGPEADAIIRSAGGHLLSHYWGGYVAVITHPTTGRITLLRDPSGAMPCLRSQPESFVIATSDIDMLADAGFPRPRVDRDYLPRLLFAPDLRTPRSGLTDAQDLLAGHSQVLNAPTSPAAQVWSPWDYATPNLSVTDADLATELETTIRGCVTAWAGAFEQIVLGLSGGLDSSVIAACLGSCDHVTGLNLRTDDPSGDERLYARSVAAHLNLPLIEATHDVADVDVTRSSASHLPRPILYALSQSELATKRKLAKDLKVDAFFTGIGGDNVFCHMQSASPVVDRWRTPTERGHTGDTVNDLCRLTGVSWFDCVSAALKRNVAPSAYAWHGNPEFLTRPPSDEALRHPWLEVPKDALPGKAAHVAMLVRIQGTIDSFERKCMPVQINPLLSQPIMESCLKIPTWRWVAGGRNRAMTRLAFKNALPPEIINRRTKAGPDSFASDLLSTNRSKIEAHLLNGQLVEEGIIDLNGLKARFGDPKPFSPTEGMRFMALAEAEAWVRHWTA
jgi:asparagine synthase (glutamine-hydrolysing)